MAYRIRRKKSVKSSARKIALEQIDKAIEEIVDEDIDPDETVHQVRKRCKKLRGLVRLVRPVFDDYKRENAFFRDIARELSPMRDAQVATETFDALLRQGEDQAKNGDRFAVVRRALSDRSTEVTAETGDLDRQLCKCLKKLRRARRRVKRWKIDERGFPALEGGLKKVYGRARKALRKAYEQPGTENFHDWRKRVKYHWYHDRLLRGIWSPMMDVACTAAKELGDLLGDDHDLMVLRQRLLDQPDRYGGERELQGLIELIDQRSEALRLRARPLGERLFAENPSKLASRYGHYWRTWRKT